MHAAAPHGTWQLETASLPCCHVTFSGNWGSKSRAGLSQPQVRPAIISPSPSVNHYIMQVSGWAQRQFLREVGRAEDRRINLSRACLLIALEEEAAVEMHPELESELRDMPIGWAGGRGMNAHRVAGGGGTCPLGGKGWGMPIGWGGGNRERCVA